MHVKKVHTYSPKLTTVACSLVLGTNIEAVELRDTALHISNIKQDAPPQSHTL